LPDLALRRILPGKQPGHPDPTAAG
jgi:hypothetical protein